MSRFSDVFAGLRKVARRFRSGKTRESSRREPGISGLRHPQMEPLEDRVLLSIDTEIRRAVIVGISNYAHNAAMSYPAVDARRSSRNGD